MREKIVDHIKVLKAMERTQIPYGFIKKFGEDRCRLVSEGIVKWGLLNRMEHFHEEAKAYLMNDPEIIRKLSQVLPALTEGETERLDELLCRIGEKKLSEFEAADIQEILMDEEIPVKSQYPYLLYFKQMHLSKEERARVFEALEKYRGRVIIPLAQLSEQERNVLLHPVFLSNLLNELLNDKKIWTLLTYPPVLPLLRRIEEESAASLRLSVTGFCQIAEHPEQILQLLEKTMRFLQKELRPAFLDMWLWNNRLLADLKRFVYILPSLNDDQKKDLIGNRISYVCTLYQTKLTNLKLQELSYLQQQVLLYAIVSGKKHFLSLVNENSEVFQELPNSSFLLDQEIYEHYLNLNTLNEKNLKEASQISTSLRSRRKGLLQRKTYTFEELKQLLTIDEIYVQLYERLSNDRSDDRLRILRELVNCNSLTGSTNETELKMLAERLSEKPLSVWKHTDFGQIQDLREGICIQLLKGWDRYCRYIPELRNERQAIYLIRNRDVLGKYDTFKEFQENMLAEDIAWKWLRENLNFNDVFIKQHEARIRQFIYSGQAEIIYQFCQGAENKREEIRRLLAAELMGKFQEVKYHEKDLEKEIAYPITPKAEAAWKENMTRRMKKMLFWEEDHFVPTLQIGEVPKHTCMSYQNGVYKNCLLSCFDSNKKVLYASINGKIVFRALLRLTKGAWESRPIQAKKIEFADLTANTAVDKKKTEELVLFLERPYFGGLHGKLEEEMVSFVLQLVQEKAQKLQARLVISQNYAKYETFRAFQNKEYYIYISASKNGSQYLDSLGGEATVRDSGMYECNRFLFEPENRTESGSRNIQQ